VPRDLAILMPGLVKASKGSMFSHSFFLSFLSSLPLSFPPSLPSFLSIDKVFLCSPVYLFKKQIIYRLSIIIIIDYYY
jgi:hypothetical protein